MFFHRNVSARIQQQLDHESRLEEGQRTEIHPAESVERPFAMTGLYDLIPDSDPSPLRIDTGTAADER